MPTLDLRRLAAEEFVEVVEELDSGLPLWEGTGLTLAGPVKVDLVAHETGESEVVARGELSTVLARECRRCLATSEERFELDVTFVWSGDVEFRGEGGEIRALPTGKDEIDVAEAVREELLLAVPAFTECTPNCRGLCPRCGTNLNEQSCDCTVEERDPRWDALRALQSE
ncbi:MAG: DUF177 domain-containing protein [Longimicrobiales bacterium]|nr:DUF177 domain-containing protein [Longimicrobiales bacterium]